MHTVVLGPLRLVNRVWRGARKRVNLILKPWFAARPTEPRAREFLARMKSRWERGAKREVSYWRRCVAMKGSLAGHEKIQDRLDPSLPLQDYVTKVLDPKATSVSILDVGAGPLTALGKKAPGYEIQITAVDALADDYDKILRTHGVVPVVRTEACPTEGLLNRYRAEQFDIVHVRNALDHHYDVLLALQQMLAVTKVGGLMILRHSANEAQHQGYLALHQWNFCIEADDFLVWNHETRFSLKQQFGDSIELVELDTQGGTKAHAVIRKLVSEVQGARVVENAA